MLCLIMLPKHYNSNRFYYELHFMQNYPTFYISNFLFHRNKGYSKYDGKVLKYHLCVVINIFANFLRSIYISWSLSYMSPNINYNPKNKS